MIHLRVGTENLHPNFNKSSGPYENSDVKKAPVIANGINTRRGHPFIKLNIAIIAIENCRRKSI